MSQSPCFVDVGTTSTQYTMMTTIRYRPINNNTQRLTHTVPPSPSGSKELHVVELWGKVAIMFPRGNIIKGCTLMLRPQRLWLFEPTLDL